MLSKALGASILVDRAGMTLYHFTAEKGKKIRCTGRCATLWPPLLIARAAKPRAGAGADKKKLGTVRRPDGRMQVTYSGLALYRYSGDRKPGEAKGEGFRRAWFAITPSGRLLTKPKNVSG
jgi:predicted lipoprotein with Yx(FWY)xxD motif